MSKIEKRSQKCLGWYHSHPYFEPTPSHVDIENHNAYQRIFSKSKLPYMGLIIAPYFKAIQPVNIDKKATIKSKCSKEKSLIESG